MQTGLTRRRLLGVGALGLLGCSRPRQEDAMLNIRRAAERGHADHGWLDSYHTFSFADYYDPRHMGFRALRVINEDRVQPSRGFGTHPHKDMEIISYVLEGGLQHRDSMGTGSVIRPGDVQRMSAGRGVTHSEFNASERERVHFLQIWLMPTERGLAPSYEQKFYSPAEKDGRLRLIASPSGEDNSVTIHADARLYAAILGVGQSVEYPLSPGRHAWVHVAKGEAEVNGQHLKAGDAAALSDERAVQLSGTHGGEILLFDLG